MVFLQVTSILHIYHFIKQIIRFVNCLADLNNIRIITYDVIIDSLVKLVRKRGGGIEGVLSD